MAIMFDDDTYLDSDSIVTNDFSDNQIRTLTTVAHDIDYGRTAISAANIAAGSVNYNITFNHTFKVAPIVLASLQLASASTAVGLGTVKVFVVQGTTTTTGCTLRVTSGVAVAVKYYVNWVAVSPTDSLPVDSSTNNIKLNEDFSEAGIVMNDSSRFPEHTNLKDVKKFRTVGMYGWGNMWDTAYSQRINSKAIIFDTTFASTPVILTAGSRWGTDKTVGSSTNNCDAHLFGGSYNISTTGFTLYYGHNTSTGTGTGSTTARTSNLGVNAIAIGEVV